MLAALTDAELTTFLDLARQCSLTALVEVHDDLELARAIESGAEVTVLVNGRAVARIVPLETPPWVDGERAGHIYNTAVDPGWEGELRAGRGEDIVGDPWS